MIGYKVAGKIKATTLLMHGQKDDLVPIGMSKKFYQLLKCPKKFIIFKNADHFIKKRPWQDRTVRLTVSWFKKYL